jgi:hypothetical protein
VKHFAAKKHKSHKIMSLLCLFVAKLRFPPRGGYAALRAFNPRHFDAVQRTLAAMSKAKNPGTGEGYLGETMVHRISHALGVVVDVIEAKSGWPPEITLKLKDGSVKKGRLSEFREPNSAELKAISPAAPNS